MEHKRPTICVYCGRQYPKEQLKKIEEDKGSDNTYCPKCIKGVRSAIRNLPWNKKY